MNDRLVEQLQEALLAARRAFSLGGKVSPDLSPYMGLLVSVAEDALSTVINVQRRAKLAAERTDHHGQ